MTFELNKDFELYIIEEDETYNKFYNQFSNIFSLPNHFHAKVMVIEFMYKPEEINVIDLVGDL